MRLKLADVSDAEGLARAVLDERMRMTNNGRAGAEGTPDGGDNRLDMEDALGNLMAECWALYRKWDPTRGVPFRAYGVGMLRHALVRWYQRQFGRGKQPKLQSVAVSLDATPDTTPRSGLGGSVQGGDLDPSTDSVAALRRALVRRDSSDPRGVSAVGGGADG